MVNKIPEKILKSIESRLSDIREDSFSQDTIKLLLIELRDYIAKESPLKEIAHFIAHPERDRGEILETVNYAYNRSRVLFRQLEGKKTGKGLELDINNLPIDLYETVVKHHSKIKPDIYRLSKFRKAFEFDSSKNVYTAKRFVSKKIIRTIQEAVNILSLQPVLTQPNIIDEIVASLQDIGLADYGDAIITNQIGLMVCFLAILHQSTFKLKDGNTAKAYLGNDPVVNDLEGKVHILASVKTEFSNVPIAFTLISSEVTIKESFSESMFKKDIPTLRTDYHDSDYIEARRNDKGMIMLTKA